MYTAVARLSNKLTQTYHNKKQHCRVKFAVLLCRPRLSVFRLVVTDRLPLPYSSSTDTTPSNLARSAISA